MLSQLTDISHGSIIQNMTKNKDILELEQKLASFGLDNKTAALYTALMQGGPQGIVAITRKLGIGRNVAYRLIEELQEKQLVSVAEKSFGKEYSALGPAALEGLIARREAQTAGMRASLDTVVAGLQVLAGTDTKTKIVHYEGVDGLKQVNWNLTKAKKEFRVFELSHVSDYLDKAFSEKIRHIWAEKRITSYDITNKKVIEPHTSEREYAEKYSKYCHIDKAVLDIKFEMFIYNNVVTLVDYGTDKPQAVEVYNQNLADMQMQLFDVIWKQGKEMPLDPKTGTRSVKA